MTAKKSAKPRRPRSAAVREAYQSAIVRYQIMRALEKAAQNVRNLAEKFSAAARAARDLAEERSRSATKRPTPTLRALIETLSKRVHSASHPTGDVVADRFLDTRVPSLVSRRIGSAPFNAATATSSDLHNFARALDEVADFARKLPVPALPQEGTGESDALVALLGWSTAQRVDLEELARMLAEAELDPPGKAQSSEAARRARWRQVLKSGAHR